MRIRFLALVVTLSALALPMHAVPAAATAPGGVFVTGHDPDFHSLLGGNQLGARHLIQSAVDYVTFGTASPAMLYVTSRITPPAGHVDGSSGLAGAGFTFDMASAGGAASTLDLATVDFTAYDVVVIASDFGGLLTQAELDILNARAGHLIDYVNGGGGLVAFSEGNSGARLTPGGGHYDFLPFLASELQLNQNETGFTVTPFGASLGLVDSDVNGNASHNFFTDTGGMNVVNRDGAGRIMSLATRGTQICTGGVPNASVDDVTQPEGTAATPTAFTFTVSLSVAPCGGSASVDLTTGDGTAVVGSDYALTDDTLTFQEGETTKTVTIPVAADSSFEPDETFFVTLVNATGLAIGDGQGLGTILNDDAQNNAPDCSSAVASATQLWPPDHTLRSITLSGITDIDGNEVTTTIGSVMQDEPLDGTGDGDTSPDAVLGSPSDTVLLRAERAARGDGRVYRVAFTASDGQADCSGTTFVTVPHNQSAKGSAVDSGGVFDSFGP